MKKKKDLEYPVCNLCQSKDYDVLFDNMTYWEYPGSFRVVSCRNCKLVFTNPRPVLAKIGQYYTQENYWGRDFDSKEKKYNDARERDTAYGMVYDLLLKQKKKGKILDIGAGTGLFLSKLKELGWDVSGVEISPEAVKYAKKQYNISLKKGDVFDVAFPKNTYDVVVLNGALEHMYDPMKTLQLAYALLKNGGILIFSVPNVDSIGKAVFGSNWFPWQLPRHLYHFSPTTIRAYLKKITFKNITIYHNYWIQNQYILFQSPRYGFSPKFKKSKKGGLAQKQQNTLQKFSLKKEVAKVMVGIFSYVVAYIEPIIEHGEVVLVYAEKTR